MDPVIFLNELRIAVGPDPRPLNLGVGVDNPTTLRADFVLPTHIKFVSVVVTVDAVVTLHCAPAEGRLNHADQ